MSHKRLFIFLALLLAVLTALGIAQPAAAELKAIAVFNIWDDATEHFAHSIVSLYMDGAETHVFHELGFNDDLYDPTVPGPLKDMCDRVAALEDPAHPEHDQWVENCPEARPSAFAGVLELGMPYDKVQDNGTALAIDHTEDWGIIDCDLNGDESWDGLDLDHNTLLIPPELLANWTLSDPPIPLPLGDQSDYFKVLAIDVVTVCAMGNCSHEIVTTIFVDLDINGDGQLTQAGDGLPVDASGALPGARACFFAEVFPIAWPTTPASPVWVGNPQARITAGGGDKTVNFTLYGPTAVHLTNLTAAGPVGITPEIWTTAFVLLAAFAATLIRHSRRMR